MIIYLFLISIPTIFYFVAPNKNTTQKILLFFTGFIYIFFIGFRHEVGMDWFNYILIYDYISDGTIKHGINRTEPAYALLNWLSAQMSFDIYGSNFIIAIIFVSGLINLAGKMPNPWVALISVTPYLVIAIGMSGVRQSAAIGFVFHLIAGWKKNSFIKNIILAVVATLFHYSAFVALFFVIQNITMPKIIRWGVLIVGSVISFIIFSKTDHYTYYEQSYITANLISPGALQHLSLNAIPSIIYLLFIKKWNKLYGKNNVLIILSYLSLLSILALAVSSTGVDRLALYLSPIQMLVYSSIPVVFKNKLYSMIIIVIHFLILYIWLTYSNSSIAFLPYKNILFI